MNCFKRWNSIPFYHGLFGNLPWKRLKSPHNLSSTFVFLKLCITFLITTTFSIIHLFWHKSNMSYRIYNLIKKWPQASIYWLITQKKKKRLFQFDGFGLLWAMWSLLVGFALFGPYIHWIQVIKEIAKSIDSWRSTRPRWKSSY